MIKQDYTTAMALAEQRAQQIEPPAEIKKDVSDRSGFSVLAVQSIACVVIVLLAFLMRAAGGSAYEQLRQGFAEGLMSNELLAAVLQLWDGDPSEADDSDELQEDGEDDIPDTSTTAAADVSHIGSRLA